MVKLVCFALFRAKMQHPFRAARSQCSVLYSFPMWNMTIMCMCVIASEWLGLGLLLGGDDAEIGGPVPQFP